MDGLASLKRADLQRMCREHGIKANGKNEQLVRKIFSKVLMCFHRLLLYKEYSVNQPALLLEPLLPKAAALFLLHQLQQKLPLLLPQEMQLLRRKHRSMITKIPNRSKKWLDFIY